MTPLRQKMIDLMTFRQLAPKTCQVYLSAVTKLTTHYHRSPECISSEEIKQWLMGISRERKWSASTIHQTLMALKFCYEQVLEQSNFLSDFQLPKRPQKILILLTQKEVYAILHATKNLKHLTLLSLCYGCGLRASEAVILTQNDIDSERLLLRVVQGKGRKDRNIPLSPSLLRLLRYYWKTWELKHYFFCSTQKKKKTLGISSAQKIFKHAKANAHINKEGGIHGLRHAYATHQLEQGLPIHQLQLFLGHSDVRVTMKYLHWVPRAQVIASDLLEQFTPDEFILKTKPENYNEQF